jgi:hypothetical protein
MLIETDFSGVLLDDKEPSIANLGLHGRNTSALLSAPWAFK